MSQIIIDSLNVAFSGDVVVKNLDLVLGSGEFVSIIGPYGCGKTTLLKSIAGLIDAYDGEINIDGYDSKELRKHGKIGYCSQKPTLLPWLSVEKNILLPVKLSPKRDAINIEMLLKLTKLKKSREKKIYELSGGLQQMVAIVRSLVLQPEILLLDEPFSSIDEISREELEQELLNIHKLTKKTTILITHSITEAVYLSDRIVVLSKKPASIKKIISIQLTARNNKIRYTDRFVKYVKLAKAALDE